jgi:hypothetical protein
MRSEFGNLIRALSCEKVVFATCSRPTNIVVAQPYRAVSSLPAGLDHAEIAVLDWITAEGRRQGRGRLSM